MTRKSLRSLLVAAACLAFVPGCISPFSDHGADVREAWTKKLHSAHRRYDRYILGLDWDDPYHEWHDESYASGPMIR